MSADPVSGHTDGLGEESDRLWELPLRPVHAKRSLSRPWVFIRASPAIIIRV